MGLSRVVVLYPRGTRTGGPEALHQLVDALRRFGLPAGLAPHAPTRTQPRVEAYQTYDAPEIDPPKDVTGEVVIGPEIYVRELMKFRRARAMCWWLSIDNSPLFRAERRWFDLRHRIGDPVRPGDLFSVFDLARRGLIPWRRRLGRMEHLAQSDYAQAYLSRRLGIESWSLSDYIADATSTDPRAPADQRGRPLRIAFNPAKGAQLTRRVQKAMSSVVDWDPLVGLSPDGVREHLAMADLYLDLGPHPGKDRLPREAAMSGAVTVVAERGAAVFDGDVPIPNSHKVSVLDDPVESAINVLEGVMVDLGQAFRMQRPYREAIARQREVFDREVARLAEALTAGSPLRGEPR